MSWLDDFLLAIRRVRNSAGEVQPPRGALQFGPGFTVTDDPATNALIIGGGGGGGGATGPTGPTGPTGATGPAGSSGVASQLPSGWAELAGNVGFSPGPTLINQTSVTTETTCHVWAAVSISWQTTLASSGAAFFVTLSNGVSTYTSDETWSDATAADDDVSASINFRTPVPVTAGTWTARVYGRRTKSTSSLVCTHCDLTVLGFQGAQGATGPTGPAPSGSGVVLVESGVAYAGTIFDVNVNGSANIAGSKLQAASALNAGAMSAADYGLIPASGDIEFLDPRVATVVGLRNNPIGATPPASGQVLQYDGSQWLPQTVSTGITSGDVTVSSGGAATVTGLQGYPVDSVVPLEAAFLTWDGSGWVPYRVFEDSDLTYVPGTSLTVSKLQGRAVSSTAPSIGQVLAYDGTQWAPSVRPPDTMSAQINMKLTGDTLLGTTLPGYGRFVVIDAWAHLDTIASLGVTPPTVSIGWASGSGYSEFVSLQSLPNSGIVNNNYSAITLRSGSGRLSAPASTGIYCRVTQASNATTYTATIVVKGFYLVD
jgi:hypothetical protein